MLDDGKAAIALVGVDALCLHGDVVNAARREIQAQCGLAPDHVLVAASHTHSGGPVGKVQPGQDDFASEFIRLLAYECGNGADPACLDRIRARVVEAVYEAYGGRGYETRLTTNANLEAAAGRRIHQGSLGWTRDLGPGPIPAPPPPPPFRGPWALGDVPPERE